MNLITLAIAIVIISASGALSPGPLTVMTMASGARFGWKAGLKVAIGHTIAELPYVILLALLLDMTRTFLENYIVKTTLALITIFFMVFFAYMLIRDYMNLGKSNNENQDIPLTASTRTINPLVIGVVFTLFNPYFLLWWATLGLELIKRSLELGLIMGILYLYMLHVWMDYVWLIFVAGASASGVKYLGLRGYRALLLILAVMLLLFALNMFTLTFLNIAIIPI